MCPSFLKHQGSASATTFSSIADAHIGPWSASAPAGRDTLAMSGWLENVWLNERTPGHGKATVPLTIGGSRSI